LARERRRRRRGESQRKRRSSAARVAMVWRGVTPLMAVWRASVSTVCKRQRERGVGEEGEAPGEKGDCGFAQLIEDERGEQFSVQVGLGELWLVGAQAIEFEDALEALEGELDLPAQAVELERLGRRQDVGGGGR
jgi:hypothetical protein